MEDCLMTLYQSQISIGLCAEMGRVGEEYFVVYLEVYFSYNKGL